MHQVPTLLNLLGQSDLSHWELFTQECIKNIPDAFLAGVGAALALFIGNRVATFWALRQKRREIELTTLNSFYGLYGEFFATWKLWNHSLKLANRAANHSEISWQLIERATAAESELESFLVKISSERVLTELEVQELGLFRQAFQTLRNQMRKDEKLDWHYSEHEEYATFKRIACLISTLLLSNESYDKPTADLAQRQLTGITSNKNQVRWKEVGVKERGKNGVN